MPLGPAKRGVHQPDIDKPRFGARIIGQHAVLHMPRRKAEPVDRRFAHMDGRAGMVQQIDPFGDGAITVVIQQRVVVAADQNGADARAGQAAQFDRKRRPAGDIGDAGIEDIPGQKHGIDLLLDRHVDQPRKHRPRGRAQAGRKLGVTQGLRPQGRVKVQVGGM